MAGRKPVGPALVERVSGSEQAQQRAVVLLETITGAKTMDEACRALGIEKTRLFKLRTRMLEAAVASLEPQPIGRPPLAVPAEAARVAELEAEINRLQVELTAAGVRVELAQALRALGKEAVERKKNQRRLRRKRNR